MSTDEIIRRVQEIYGWLDGLEISANTLLGLAALFLLAGILATREAVAWFLKVGDIKKDLRRLHGISLQLEGEIRVLQRLVQETQAQARVQSDIAAATAATTSSAPGDAHIEFDTTVPQQNPLSADDDRDGEQAEESRAAGPSRLFRKKEKRPKSGAFPLSH